MTISLSALLVCPRGHDSLVQTCQLDQKYFETKKYKTDFILVLLKKSGSH